MERDLFSIQGTEGLGCVSAHVVVPNIEDDPHLIPFGSLQPIVWRPSLYATSTIQQDHFHLETFKQRHDQLHGSPEFLNGLDGIRDGFVAPDILAIDVHPD